MALTWGEFEKVDMRVGVVVNFPPKQVGAVVLLHPDHSVAPGSTIG